jgi:hypothetical protein
VVDDRQPGAFKRCDRGVIAPRIEREANRAGQDRDETVVAPRPDVAVEQLGQHSRRHMGIALRGSDPGRPRPLDLRVAHPDIVDMEDHGTFDTEGAGQGHDRG